jgi:hypothetical protein
MINVRIGNKRSSCEKVLQSAARLQGVVPDLVLVGESAAALHAAHRESVDHDHVMADLVDRYDSVLEAVEATGGWATSVRASKPPATLLGSLDGVPGGIRQLRRSKPLDVEEWTLPTGETLRVPTIDEILRIKAYLVIDRRAVRDFLDVVALADRVGVSRAAQVLSHIDEYYTVRSGEEGGVLHEIALALAHPAPIDKDVIPDLPRYKSLDVRWHEWATVVAHCQDLSLELLDTQ